MVEPLDTKAWVMVPVEPTTEMIGAAMRVDFDNEDEVAITINLWHAMVSASPSPPVVDGGEIVAWLDPVPMENGYTVAITEQPLENDGWAPLVRQSAFLAAESRVQSLEEALRHLSECNLTNPNDFRQFARNALKVNGNG